MRLGLKNIKLCNHVFNESAPFTATITCDGKDIGTVTDDGNGGSWLIHGKDAACNKLLRELEAEAKAESAEPIADAPEHMLNLEMAIATLLDDYANTKKLVRQCRTKTVFTLHSEPGGYSVIDAAYGVAVSAYLKKKFGADLNEILNELPKYQGKPKRLTKPE